MYVVVVGGGKVGYHLAKALLQDGHEVLIIERDRARCEHLEAELGDIVLRGDGSEVATMEKAGFNRADMVVAVTGDDEDNLVICQVAKAHFRVPRTVALVNDPKNAEIFHRLGIDHTVNATDAILAQIEQELPVHALIHLLSMRGGGLEMVEVRIPPQAAVVGHKLREVLLPQQSIVVLIIEEDGSPKAPEPDTVLRPGDKVMLVTRSENEEALREVFTRPPGYTSPYGPLTISR
ncbi:MAG: TrkA family potassium uptake protein [Dehalococcoidia bacterium]|jgi:trk system potassium uptake protein TrkA|nr:TrkA family potassium uptake protein [Dehalococcoidia bacterium]